MYTSQGKQSFEMRKLLVSLLNGSLKYHADVIAGRQFHQIRMSKYLMIDSHHQLIVKCCYFKECLKKV